MKGVDSAHRAASPARPAPRVPGWRAWAACTAVAVAVFAGWPALDLWISRRVWDAQGGFGYGQLALVQASYRGVPWVARALLGAAVLLGLACLTRPGLLRRAHRHTLAVLGLTMALGLGLVVDVGLKDHWGRPRPLDTQDFGGREAFRPALWPGGPCRNNCAFVSGHAATGALLLALASVGPARCRRRWWWAGLGASALIGAGRVLQGGHYVSDVVFAFLVIWAVCLAASAGLRAARRAAAGRRRGGSRSGPPPGPRSRPLREARRA